jgi:hypothetical protein
MRQLAIALPLVASLLGASTADAAMMCQSKKGAVFVRDPSCKKKETPVDAVALGLQVCGCPALPGQLTGAWDVVVTAGPSCAPSACDQYVYSWVLTQSSGLVVGTFVAEPSCILQTALGNIAGNVAAGNVEFTTVNTGGTSPGYTVRYSGAVSADGNTISGTLVDSDQACATFTAHRR